MTKKILGKPEAVSRRSVIKICFSILLAMFCALVTGCGASHEHVWEAVTCTKPKTCIECGEIEGEPLGHTYADATCTEPQTCTVCGVMTGEALGHNPSEPTCTSPGICKRCGEVISQSTVPFSAWICLYSSHSEGK